MGDQAKDGRGTFLLQKLGGPDNLASCVSGERVEKGSRHSYRVAGIDQIVDDDADAICYITHENHARALAICDLGGSALFVDQGEAQT